MRTLIPSETALVLGGGGAKGAYEIGAIAALNDLLGGVTVTLQDDFTMADPAMQAGATITLTGEQAVTLVLVIHFKAIHLVYGS